MEVFDTRGKAYYYRSKQPDPSQLIVHFSRDDGLYYVLFRKDLSYFYPYDF